MYRALDSRQPEVEIRGELWVNLDCGHQIRLETAITSGGESNMPVNRQWCSACDRGTKETSGEVYTKPDPQGAPRGHESNCRTIGGVKHWFWRGRWRPWKS